ncbi:hypothetical protein Tco_1155640 [Tanacetum coccineum]
MESSSSNPEESELQQMQLEERNLHQKCMAWFKELKSHLGTLHKFSEVRNTRPFEIAFCIFFHEEHHTFREKMYHNLDQLQLQLERENLHSHDSKTCFEQCDDNLVAKESTDDSATSSEQLDKISSSKSDEDLEKILVDTVGYDIENADIGPSYDSDTVFEVQHDTFENMFANEIQSHEQHDSISDTYVVSENNRDIISNIPYMDPDRGNEEHDYVAYEKQHTFFSSLSNNLKCDVEKCTKVDREAQQANALLINELERYKEKEKQFAKETTIEYEYCKKIKFLNDEISNLKSQALNLKLVKMIRHSPGKIESMMKMKEDLKHVMSLEDEFDDKCLILDIQTEFFKTQFESAISESHSHVYENRIVEQNSSLENENRCLKKTITELSKQASNVKEEMTKRYAQYEKDFAKLETHCNSLEIKSQNKSSTSVQNGQVLSNKSDEAKIKFDTEDHETINIELEYSVASLL